MADEISGRLHDTPTFLGGTPVLDNTASTPGYEGEGMTTAERKDFELHIAEAGCAKSDGGIHAGVLSPKKSWTKAASDILIEGDILAREDPNVGLIEVEASQSKLREFLPRSECPTDVLVQCCKSPSALVLFPEFGIRAFWIAVMGGSRDALEFDVGPRLVESVRSMNYQHEDGLARTYLRIMGRIAAGEDDKVEGHREREGPGPGDRPLSDSTGRPVMRAYLSNHTSDPHRLFWLRGDRPTFLNVTGHEGGPIL